VRRVTEIASERSKCEETLKRELALQKKDFEDKEEESAF
jgi:hypothetical protein